MKDVVSKYINNFPLTMDNVVMVAATAQELSHFEEVSKNLLKGCVDLLSTRLVDVKSVLTFISKNGDGSTVLKLLKDLDSKKESICNNCGKLPCQLPRLATSIHVGFLITTFVFSSICPCICLLQGPNMQCGEHFEF